MKYLQKLSSAASSLMGFAVRLIIVASGFMLDAGFQNQFLHIIVNISLVIIMIISFTALSVISPTNKNNSIDGINSLRVFGVITLILLAATVATGCSAKVHDNYTDKLCAIILCTMAANIALNMINTFQSENNKRSNSHQKISEAQSELIRLHRRFNLKYDPFAKSTHLPLPSNIGSNALVITRTNTTPIYPGAMDPIEPKDLLPYSPYRTIAILDDDLIGVKTANSIKEDSPVAWQQAHDDSLSQTIAVIVNAINNNKKKINIVYEYDGIEAYATGIWPVADNKSAQEYVSKLTSLASQIDISFTKLNDNIFNYYQPLITLANRN